MSGPTRGRGRGRGRRVPDSRAFDDATPTAGPSDPTDNADGDVPMPAAAPVITENDKDNGKSLFVPNVPNEPNLSAAKNASAALQDIQAAPTPQSTSENPPSSTAAPPATSTRRPLAAPRGAVRRSKEARAALEAAAALKRGQEAKLSRKDDPSRGRGRGAFRGRGGSGRGGFMGDRLKQKDSTASGAFSSGLVTADAKRRSANYSSGGGGSSGSYTGYFRSGGAGGSGHIKSEGGAGAGYTSINVPMQEDDSDIEYMEDGPRRDIETINLVSDDENQDAAPVRIQRTKHKKRQDPISLEASVQDAERAKEDIDAVQDAAMIKRRPSSPATPRSRKGKERAAAARDNDIVETGSAAGSRSVPHSRLRWRGMWQGEDDKDDEDDDKSRVKIKKEPIEDSESAIATTPKRSPRKPKSRDKTPPTPTPGTSRPDAAAIGPGKQRRMSSRKPKSRTSRRLTMPEAQTEEERAEHERYMRDLEMMRQELGSLQTMTAGDDDDDAVENAEGDLDDEARAAKAAARANAAGRNETVYLFQFPPVLPELAPAPAIKQEPQSPELSRAGVAVPGTAGQDDKARTNTADKPIKIEDSRGTSGSNTQTAALAPSALETSRSQMPTLSTGKVGKLRVHASGRTTLDWGGTALEVHLATDAQFLQDVLVVEMDNYPPPKPDLDGNGGNGDADKAVGEKNKSGSGKKVVGAGGRAMGLGAVRGKFVVTPEWDKIL